MGKPYFHAQNAAREFGGVPEDYLAIEEFMDSSRKVLGDMRHRALTHHTWFIYEVLVRIFGTVITNSADKTVSVAEIGELHVKDDFNGQLPNAQDFLEAIEIAPWMTHCQDGHLPPSAVELAKIQQLRTSPKEMMTDGSRLPYIDPMSMRMDL